MRAGADDQICRLRKTLVAANRILARLGVLDGYGHVSARHPEQPSAFVISRSLAPELVTEDDLLELDFAGHPLNGDSRPQYLETCIHSEIYAARPDVAGIVHSHALPVVAFSASDVSLRPIHHMSGFLGSGAPVFDSRTQFGDTDLLIRTSAHGAALARALAEASVVLMRGHGFVAAAPSLKLAVFRAVYTVTNAAAQATAVSLGGEVTFLSPKEASLADATNAGTVDKPWALWARHAGVDLA
jgi:ribulose-5-phosphate 4-epimerase/fuculose-1-phosphate aldolase